MVTSSLQRLLLATVTLALVLAVPLTHATGVSRPVDDAGPDEGASYSLDVSSPGPPPGRRYIVGFAPEAPRRGRRDVAAVVAREGGRVVLTSNVRYNPFLVVEGDTSESAARIVAALNAAGITGVVYVEEDVVRRALVPRPLQGEALAGALRQVRQMTAGGSGGPMQPYGLRLVQATRFTRAQRSTTSSVDPSKKFPICVIDSGFDATHPSLQGVSLRGGSPVGFSADTCGHGSHVAGTISARQNSDPSVLSVDGVLNGDVDMFMVKVFDTARCGWVYASTLTVAMQACTSYGARVVSMSLGASSFTRTEDTQINAMFNTRNMLVFAAAGNSGTSTAFYPASYTNAISVAAVDAAMVKAPFSNFNAGVELAAPGVAVLSTVPQVVANARTPSPLVLTLEGTRQYATGLGDLLWVTNTPQRAFSGTVLVCGTTDCPANTGRVCVMPRGDVSFCAKAQAALRRGCVALLVPNNAPGIVFASVDACSNANIPTLTLAREQQQFFVNGAQVTASLAASPLPYGAWDGTSMATPHAAASAVLVWGMRPSCSSAAVRCALQRSALDLGRAGRDTSFGFGLVQAAAAVARLRVVGSTCTCV